MGMCRSVSFVFVAMSISQIPGIQTLESRWGYCTKQDYIGSQVTYI